MEHKDRSEFSDARPARLIVINGCSYTRGQELEEPANQCWPAHLSRLTGIPVENISRDGASNRRIVRSTVELLTDAMRRHDVTAADTLVMIMWTSLSRSECYRPKKRDTGGCPPKGENLSWKRIGLWTKHRGDPMSRAYFRHLWHEEGAAVDFFLEWILLDAYLISLGTQVRFALAWDILPDTICPAARALSRRLDLDRVYGRLCGGTTNSFRSSVEQLDDFGPDRHPLAAAHKYFAEACILPWLASTGCVRPLTRRND